MINSMTGFAGCETTVEFGQLSWELRSVNHRYLEVQIRLPETLRSLDAELRAQLGTQLLRGKVDASLSFRPAQQARGRLELDQALAQKLLSLAAELRGDKEAMTPVNPFDVLRWPGVVNEATPDTAALLEPARALFGQALDDLCAARAREGERIAAMLTERLDAISQLTQSVRARLPAVLEQLRQRMQEKAQALAVKVDAERLEQEVVLLAQKMDVAEELDRLDAHVAEVRSTLQQPGAVGRRLDFLLQEFNREANTLGSKSLDSETTRAAVELKVLIEQLREQVQNVE